MSSPENTPEPAGPSGDSKPNAASALPERGNFVDKLMSPVRRLIDRVLPMPQDTGHVDMAPDNNSETAREVGKIENSAEIKPERIRTEPPDGKPDYPPNAAPKPFEDRRSLKEIMVDLFELSPESEIGSVEKQPFHKLLPEFLRKTAKNPPGIMGHIRELDAGLRGRDLGGLSTRLLRTGIYSGVALGAGITDAVDFVVDGVMAPILGPFWIPIGNALEFASDWVVKSGTDYFVSQVTGRKNAQYSSAGVEAVNFAVNLVPVLQDFINGPMIESAFRILYNIPVLGVPVENAYLGLANLYEKAETDPKLRWAKDLLKFVAKGSAKRVFGKVPD